MIIQDILTIWTDGNLFMPSSQIVLALTEKWPNKYGEKSRWGTDKRRGITVQGLGRILAHDYGIKSERETSGRRRRGYLLKQFQ